jgi:hypothetical protein
MKLTPDEERYTREVAAQIGRDPDDLIREGERFKVEGYREAAGQAERLAHGGHGLGAYACEPAALRAAADGPQLLPRQRQADREAGG